MSEDLPKEGEEKKQPANGQDQEKQLAELKEEMEALKKEKEELETRLTSQDDELLSEEYMKYLQGQGGEEKKKEEGSVDFDQMTNAEMVAELEKRFQADFSKREETSKKERDEMRTFLQRSLAYLDLELTKVKKPGLAEVLSAKDGQEEFRNIAKDNPKWSAAQIYEHMEARRALDEKKKQEMEKEKRKKEREVIAEPDTVAPNAAQKKRMTAQEAVDLAYKQSFGNEE